MEYFAAIHVPENAVYALFLFMIMASGWPSDCLVSGRPAAVGEWVKQRLHHHRCVGHAGLEVMPMAKPVAGRKAGMMPVCAERMLATEYSFVQIIPTIVQNSKTE
jgi:hypothetical protein